MLALSIEQSQDESGAVFGFLSSGLYFVITQYPEQFFCKKDTSESEVNGEEDQRGRRENMEERRRSRAGQDAIEGEEIKESISKCHCHSLTTLLSFVISLFHSCSVTSHFPLSIKMSVCFSLFTVSISYFHLPPFSLASLAPLFSPVSLIHFQQRTSSVDCGPDSIVSHTLRHRHTREH